MKIIIFLLHTLLLFYDNLKLGNNNKKLNTYTSVKLNFNMQQCHETPVILTRYAMKQEENTKKKKKKKKHGLMTGKSTWEHNI